MNRNVSIRNGLITYPGGDRGWYMNDKLHRLDGPAIEYADGNKVWLINGEDIDCKDNEEFLRIVKMKAFW